MRPTIDEIESSALACAASLPALVAIAKVVAAARQFLSANDALTSGDAYYIRRADAVAELRTAVLNLEKLP